MLTRGRAIVTTSVAISEKSVYTFEGRYIKSLTLTNPDRPRSWLNCMLNMMVKGQCVQKLGMGIEWKDRQKRPTI